MLHRQVRADEASQCVRDVMDSSAIVTEADTTVEVRTAGAAHAAPATSFLREIPRVMCDVVLGLVLCLS